MFEAMLAETIGIAGHGGDIIQAYYARPLTSGALPGVVVLHHMPGWDEWSKEVTRKLAYHGYAAICPHLYSRLGPGRWDDLAAAARARGGAPDAQVVGDVAGAAAFLRAQPDANGRVGVIGFCSGGRQAYMVACKVPSLAAAVDCWGGRVVARSEELSAQQPQAVIDITREMHCPLLGIFGNDDANPDVAQVNSIEEELKKYGKEYEFHRYDGAGHGFFAVDRPSYRPEQAVDGWKQVFAFSRSTFRPRPLPWPPAPGDRGKVVCTWITHRLDITAHGKGVEDWLPLTKATVYYDHPVSAPLDHALIIDFVDEAAGPGARVSVELSAESARALLQAVQAALDSGQAQHDLAAASSR